MAVYVIEAQVYTCRNECVCCGWYWTIFVLRYHFISFCASCLVKNDAWNTFYVRLIACKASWGTKQHVIANVKGYARSIGVSFCTLRFVTVTLWTALRHLLYSMESQPLCCVLLLFFVDSWDIVITLLVQRWRFGVGFLANKVKKKYTSSFFYFFFNLACNAPKMFTN